MEKYIMNPDSKNKIWGKTSTVDTPTKNMNMEWLEWSQFPQKKWKFKWYNFPDLLPQQPMFLFFLWFSISPAFPHHPSTPEKARNLSFSVGNLARTASVFRQPEIRKTHQLR